MKVQITYCAPCGYKPRAVKAATALKDKLSVETELIPGHGGIFEVSVDGKVVAQKTRMGFPGVDEIVNCVAQASTPPSV